jgi:KUP system potassium uptake protein
MQANIVRRDPREESMIKMERVQTGELRRSAKSARNFIERSRLAQFFLRTIGVFGVALIMSDGVLTPAQSVLGAIQGINVVKPDITKGTVVGVSCAILLVLFFIQPFGTTKLASSFAPIVIIWLLFNFAFGVYVSNSRGPKLSRSWYSQRVRPTINCGALACGFQDRLW